eukprot:g67825.t1
MCYADDNVCLNNSHYCTQLAHEWGRQFFGASCCDFSLSKSLFAVNGASLTIVQPLLPIRCFHNSSLSCHLSLSLDDT